MPSKSAFASALNLTGAFRQPVPQFLLFLAAGLVHGLLAWLGSQLATGAFNLSPIWPAAGFVLAAIAIFGYRLVPVLFLADLLSNLAQGTPLMAAGVQSVANLAGPGMGAALLKRYVPIGTPSSDHKDIARFLAIAGLVVPGATAALGIGGFLLLDELHPAEAPENLLTWWVGDALGHLIVAPLIFTWLNPVRNGEIIQRLWSRITPLVLISVASGLAFWQETLWGGTVVPAQVLFLPFVIWVTVRWGILGAATGNLLVVGGAISASLAGVGPYGSGSLPDFMGLESLLLLTTATTLMLGIVVSRKDTALQEAQETSRLRKNLQDLNEVIDQPYVGMLVVDGEGRVLFANSAATTLLKRSPEHLVGSSLGVPLVSGKKAEIEIPERNEEPTEVEITVNPIQWEDQAVYLVNLQDVTERKRAERVIRHQAYHDELTGLANRTQFEEHLEQRIQGARSQETGFALIFLDLDRFKEINDTLGHAAGDELLKIIGKRLQEGVRSYDLVARLSGDEFTILLDKIADRDVALKVARELREQILAPVQLKGQWLTPGGTMGLSLFPEDGEEVGSLLMRADAAMYAAKTAGRNRVHAYDPEHGMATSRRFQMGQALQGALANDEFHLVYQPQVVTADGHWVGVEALLRWQSPDQGLISPGAFIPLLEETGMIQEVGEWVFRQAHADLQQWDAIGGKVPRVWVNVAARQLEDQDLIVRLDRLARKEGLDPQRFGIELTESGIAADFENSLALLNTLKKRGFGLAMDDFGTGYSALSFLRRLPFDSVKIDRAFVGDIIDDQKDRQLIRAIINMAHSLEMTALAEGVETPDQARQLREEGCDAIQGFLYFHPITADQIPDALASSLG